MNRKKTKILKFGGSSVGTAVAIRNVSKIIQDARNDDLVVVVSAQQGVTNMLLKLTSGNESVDKIESHLSNIIKDLEIDVPEVFTLLNELRTSLESDLPQDQLQDLVASFGELISARIVTQYLSLKGVDAVFVDSRQIVITDSSFGDANYDLEKTRTKCRKLLGQTIQMNQVPVVTGFIGKNARGSTTTFSRGGSDLTATLLGQCLNANIVELWSDVDGVMSADPREVKDSVVIPELTYKEAVELSNFGAKVVHPRALVPAMEANIPVYVLSTFNRESVGTKISLTSSVESYTVTSKKEASVVTVYNPKMIRAVGYLADFFNIFNKLNLSIDVVSVSEASVSATVQNLTKTKMKRLVADLGVFGKIKIINNCAIVAVISSHFKKNQTLFHVILKELAQHNIHVDLISYGNSELNLTIVFSDSAKSTFVVNRVHKLLSLAKL